MKEQTLEKFSEAVASKEAVPGGGGVAAYAGSLASSLGEMVCNLTIGKKTYAQYEEELIEIRKEAEKIRLALLNCIQKDAEAFKPLSEAYHKDKNDPDYDEVMEQCLFAAAQPPMEILKYCCRIIELHERLSVIGSKIAVSDSGTGVMLAHGALFSAFMNVRVNTRLMKNKETAERIETEGQQLIKEYGKRAEAVFNAVLGRLA